ncbi:RNA polymerase sigma factor [Actinomadura welshii]
MSGPGDGGGPPGGAVPAGRVEELLRRSAPRAVAALARRSGRFETAEDAVQEALLAAAEHWPREGVPDRPEAWLIRVASRRMTDLLRGEAAARRREERAAARVPADERVAPAADAATDAAGGDDTLTLLMLCCHPALTPPSQVALTLRAAGGLTTAEVARAFLVPEATMAQRIGRAKQRIRAAGGRFEPPPAGERDARVGAVLRVLYLVFNEGYTAGSGPELHRAELTGEAIRLARELHGLLPGGGEAAGLLALMLLTDARRPARTAADGSLVPLAEQDRGLWDRASIAEGTALVTGALARARLGPYQAQAAIAAVHAEAARAQDTDWPQIVALYELLERLDPGPVVRLNHAVAVAMARGPRAGLELLAPLEGDARMARHHRLHAVRAHLLEMAGDGAGALAEFRAAARLTTSVPERRYLRGRAARLTG